MIERIKDWSPVIALIAIFLLLMNLRGCHSTQPSIAIIPEQARTDSFRTIIKYQDSVRVHYITKWRNKTRLVDSSPCYTEVKTIIAECDTVIKIDSILISSLKGQVSNDSVMIFKQGLMLKADSIHIVKLNKKVKRNKVIAKIAFITGLLGGGAMGVTLTK